MKRNQSAEDYLECILLLSRETQFVHRVDVARKIGVSQPAVQKAVKILQTDGLVDCDGMHIYLTQKGAEYAKEVYERHCIITEFLKMLGVEAADAERDACEMEHVVSPSTFRNEKVCKKRHKITPPFLNVARQLETSSVAYAGYAQALLRGGWIARRARRER